MAPEIVSRIFDRYYQGEDIGEKGGAGLGLSIVKNLAEMQGGQVWAESSPGEGTAITVVLPSVTVAGGSATGR
jgi:signal transduction histidine kinase